MRSLAFWVGLVLAALTLTFLVQVAWCAILVNPWSRTTFLTGILPLIAGAIALLIIGTTMMAKEKK